VAGVLGGSGGVAARPGPGTITALHKNGSGSRYGSNPDMGTLRYAAQDPLFYLHHANIDRVWSLYRYTPDPVKTPAWGKQDFAFTDLDGKTVTVTVTDVVQKMSTVRYAPPQAPAPGARLLLANAPRYAKKPPKESSETVIAKADTLTVKPLTLPAPKGKPGAEKLLSRAAAPEESSRSLLEFDVGPVRYAGRFTVRIFVNKPDATLDTSVSDPHFVGVLSALDSHAGPRSGDEKVSHKFRVNVSREVSNFYDVVRPADGFTLTLVPLGTAEALKTFSLPIKSVTLKIYEQE
jgi:hypothetical protein